tara:strand:- start:1299 stop:1706 length:408 start_codon:yes stop_codon:yes gene_type:complete
MNKYVYEASKSFNVEPNNVLSLFFSDSNMHFIQKKLALNVKQYTGKSISPQSCDEIFVIMKFVYLSLNYIDESNASKQVNLLNTLVLNELVPMVVSNVTQYFQYINDISSNPIPLERSTPSSTKSTFDMSKYVGI